MVAANRLPPNAHLAIIVQSDISQSLHQHHGIVRALLGTGGLSKQPHKVGGHLQEKTTYITY